MSRSSLRHYGGILGLFLLGILGSVLYPRLRLWLVPGPLTAMELPAGQNCKPVGIACFTENDDLSISLRLASEVQPLSTFSVEVTLEGRQAPAMQTVAVHFTMPGMEMGVNRFSLTRESGNIWRGQAMLPICSTGRRDWLATVQATGNTSYAGTFSVIAGP